MKNTRLIQGESLDIIEELFQSSGEGIMLFNHVGEIQLMNPRAEDMFGYKALELLGKKMDMLVPEDSRKNHEHHRESYMKNPSPRRMGSGRDLFGLRKDGNMFPLEISLSYMKHQNQQMVVAFITDITIRKENEEQLEEQREQLKEYTSELERKVTERTSELEHLNLGLQSQIQERKIAEEALKQSLDDLKKAEQEILQSLEKEKELSELKSRFVSMASHEFRTPLTTVLSSANLISRYTESDQQEAREKHIDRIRKSVQNLTTILNDFLSIEKLESGAQKAAKEQLLLADVINEVIEEMSTTLKEGQIINYTETDTQINTDQQILRNVLINLISNASKYSNPSDPIDIITTVLKDGVDISIKDYGIGIPQKEQKNLFERFYRAGNATNIQGTGLGLNIVKKYADLLNGKITFDSKEGEGSIFTLRLPF